MKPELSPEPWGKGSIVGLTPQSTSPLGTGRKLVLSAGRVIWERGQLSSGAEAGTVLSQEGAKARLLCVLPTPPPAHAQQPYTHGVGGGEGQLRAWATPRRLLIKQYAKIIYGPVYQQEEIFNIAEHFNF